MNELAFMLSIRARSGGQTAVAIHAGNSGLTYLDQISKYLSTDKTIGFLAEMIANYAKDKQL